MLSNLKEAAEVFIAVGHITSLLDYVFDFFHCEQSYSSCKTFCVYKDALVSE